MWQTEFIDENSLGEGNQLNQVRKVRGATCVGGERWLTPGEGNSGGSVESNWPVGLHTPSVNRWPEDAGPRNCLWQ